MTDNEFPVWLSELVFLQFVLEIKDQVGTTIGGKELSILDLFNYFGNSDPKLSDHVWVERKLVEHGISVSPPISVGSNSEKRLFTPLLKSPPDPLEEIKRGENKTQEFKSSLVYDRDRALNDPSAKVDDLDSKDVLFSALKTIAGMINKEGGLLWIGVSDQANHIKFDSDNEIETASSGLFPGLASDCTIWKMPDEVDADAFELRVRGKIDSCFWEGKRVNDSVEITFPEIFGSQVCRIKIYKRENLVFLQNKNAPNDYKLWIRQGGRTLEKKITEFETFLSERNM
jgi:hypothetical protein